MRLARSYTVDGGARHYYAPERPRVAEPARRRRIAAYLEGATPVGAQWRTDGVWVWPEHFATEVLDRGLAPEPDFLRYMERRSFQPPAPDPEPRLVAEARAAVRAGPPRPPPIEITYFVRLDPESTLDAPVSLLRRVTGPGSRVLEEGLWRDLCWHPTHTLLAEPTGYELREVSAEQAARVIDRWCERWHAELQGG